MSCDPTTSGFTPASDYVLGLAGEQLTEMGMDANGSLAWAHTNVFAAGKLIATYDPDGLHFYMTDPLGTRRAQTDYAGVLEQTCSSLPYGDSLACTGSIQFPTEHHFTGKERDTETNNDYFGARYYSSVIGRFISPDWANGADAVPYADFGNPQSLNLYGYVRNNPLAGVDPDGHILIGQEFNLGPGSEPSNEPGGKTSSTTPDPAAQETNANTIPLALGPALPSLAEIGTKLLGVAGDAATTLIDVASVPLIATTYLISPGTGGVTQEFPPAMNLVASHDNTNPYAGPVSTPVTVVDPKGNAIPVQAGQQLQGSKDGRYVQVKDATGKPTGGRIDGGGHSGHADPRAQAPHAHVPGITNPDGTPWLAINH